MGQDQGKWAAKEMTIVELGKISGPWENWVKFEMDQRAAKTESPKFALNGLNILV